jgi:hypothetical protein
MDEVLATASGRDGTSGTLSGDADAHPPRRSSMPSLIEEAAAADVDRTWRSEIPSEVGHDSLEVVDELVVGQLLATNRRRVV